MVAAASSGSSQHLTLDCTAFERLLAAAWVLQCLHDQLHPQIDGGEAIVQPVMSLTQMEVASSASQETVRPEIGVAEVTEPEVRQPDFIRPAAQPSSVIEAASKPGVLSVHSADEETLAQLLKTQEAIETGILDLDATVKRLVSLSPKLAIEVTPHERTSHESARIEPTPLEQKPNLPSQPVAEAPVIKPEVWQKPPDNTDSAPQASSFNHGITLNHLRAAPITRASTSPINASLRALRAAARAARVRVQATFKHLQAALAGYRPAFHLRTGKKPGPRASSIHLGSSFNRLSGAAVRRASTFRVNFTLRSLRAVAIATPVWLLAVIANLLLLETWLHQPFQGNQAMSAPSPSTAEAAVTASAPAPPSSTRPSSQPAKKIESTQPRRPTPVPDLGASHDRITDPATSSVVAQLSGFEIDGLRRQAKYGDDSAAFTLGMAYEVGRHVRQNCADASRWVKMAAEAGNAAAQYNLGLRYRDGDGVSADLHESENWLRKAAAHRNREAKLALQLLASR